MFSKKQEKKVDLMDNYKKASSLKKNKMDGKDAALEMEAGML
jgi:hypothetical protein